MANFLGLVLSCIEAKLRLKFDEKRFYKPERVLCDLARVLIGLAARLDYEVRPGRPPKYANV